MKLIQRALSQGLALRAQADSLITEKLLRLITWMIEEDSVQEDGTQKWHVDDMVPLLNSFIETVSLSLMTDPQSVPVTGYQLLPGITTLIEHIQNMFSAPLDDKKPP